METGFLGIDVNENKMYTYFIDKISSVDQNSQLRIVVLVGTDYDGKRARSFHYDKWYWQVGTTAHNF